MRIKFLTLMCGALLISPIALADHHGKKAKVKAVKTDVVQQAQSMESATIIDKTKVVGRELGTKEGVSTQQCCGTGPGTRPPKPAPKPKPVPPKKDCEEGVDPDCDSDEDEDPDRDTDGPGNDDDTEVEGILGN